MDHCLIMFERLIRDCDSWLTTQFDIQIRVIDDSIWQTPKQLICRPSFKWAGNLTTRNGKHHSIWVTPLAHCVRSCHVLRADLRFTHDTIRRLRLLSTMWHDMLFSPVFGLWIMCFLAADSKSIRRFASNPQKIPYNEKLIMQIQKAGNARFIHNIN